MSNKPYPHSNPPASITQRRLLGQAEKMVWLLDSQCSWNFLVHARVRGPLDRRVLEQALVLAARRHPLVLACIRRKGFSGAAFEISGHGNIPVRQVDGGLQEVESEAQAGLNARFDTENGPLARLVLVRHSPELCTILAVFHHAIGDALGGVFFLQDLIACCVDVLNGTPVLPQPPPLAAPLESRLPQQARGTAGLWGGMRFLAGLAAQRRAMGKGTLPDIRQKAGPRQRTARLFMQEISPDLCAGLRQKTRQENTTVHGALAAACMAALADGNTGGALPFYIASDVDLRSRLCPPAGRDMGFFITGVLTASRYQEQTGFWNAARQIVLSLRRSLDQGEHLYGVRMIQATDRLLGLAGAGGPGAWLYSRYTDALNPGMLVLSNIGNVRVETGAPFFTVDKLGFASSLSSTASFGLHAACCQGTLSLNFVGMEPLHGPETLSKLAAQAVGQLTRHAQAL